MREDNSRLDWQAKTKAGDEIKTGHARRWSGK
jgi:hypothetical protein